MNVDVAFVDVEIVGEDGFMLPPFLLPIELGCQIGPESGRVVDGPPIHLQVLRLDTYSIEN